MCVQPNKNKWLYDNFCGKMLTQSLSEIKLENHRELKS